MQRSDDVFYIEVLKQCVAVIAYCTLLYCLVKVMKHKRYIHFNKRYHFIEYQVANSHKPFQEPRTLSFVMHRKEPGEVNTKKRRFLYAGFRCT